MPHPIDIHIGQRLRMRRTELGLSQEKVSESLGVSFQQLQKYERGVNRMSCSRLFLLAQSLGVPVNYFFAGLEERLGEDSPGDGYNNPLLCGENIPQRELLMVMRTYARLAPKIRNSLAMHMRVLAAHQTA